MGRATPFRKCSVTARRSIRRGRPRISGFGHPETDRSPPSLPRSSPRRFWLAHLGRAVQTEMARAGELGDFARPTRFRSIRWTGSGEFGPPPARTGAGSPRLTR